MSKHSNDQPIVDRAEQIAASWEGRRLLKTRKYRAAFRLLVRTTLRQMKPDFFSRRNVE